MKIAIIDDHLLIASSLKEIIIQISWVDDVTVYTDANSFFKDTTTIRYDILLTDLMMPELNGIDVIEKCVALFKEEIKVIILSSNTNVQTIRQCLRTGAKGYISKDTSLVELEEALYEVKNGEIYISKSLTQKIVKNVIKEDTVICHFTPKEREILGKICQGTTVKEIAFEMKITTHLVQYYIRSMMNKGKVNRTAELILFAIQNGIYFPEKS